MNKIDLYDVCADGTQYYLWTGTVEEMIAENDDGFADVDAEERLRAMKPGDEVRLSGNCGGYVRVVMKEE